MKKFVLLMLCVGLFLESCKKDDDPTCTKMVPAARVSAVNQDQLAIDIGKINEFLSSKSIQAEVEPNGTRYVINSLGDGPTPCLESSINVAYTGWNMVSTKSNSFDSSTNATFPLSALVLGWQLVLPLIPAGSKVTLYIPSGYAYGSSGGGKGVIPADANLIFEIEILGIK
jgi:FKBP-type peptidyl-prolyl cis-trans isomerase